MALSKPEDIDDEPAEDNGSEAVEDAGGPMIVHDPMSGEQVTIQEALERLRDRMEANQTAANGRADHAENLVDNLGDAVYEQREMIIELTEAVEMLSENVREAGIEGVSLEKDLREEGR